MNGPITPTPVELATFVAALFILAAILYNTWYLYQGRPRPVANETPTFTPGHVHQGGEVSRHEVNGRTIVVAECHVCHGHFNLEMP